MQRPGSDPHTQTPSMPSLFGWDVWFLSLSTLKGGLLEFRGTRGRIPWCKEAILVRQMAFHIPWGAVSKQPTQMRNSGTNMNHQPDTSPCHSRISGPSSQCITQIQGEGRGLGQTDQPHECPTQLDHSEAGTWVTTAGAHTQIGSLLTWGDSSLCLGQGVRFDHWAFWD